MDSSMESSLISKLQSSDFANIHHHFLSHLRPFSPFLNSKPTTTTTTTRKPNRSSSSSSSSSSIRSLAKQFLPFLNRVLSILPKILSVSSSDLETTSLRELFDTYRLCLDCLECVSSQLACKFYSIHLQRVRMVHCFVAQAMWREAVDESFSILQSLPAGLEGRYLPDLGKTGGGDQDFCGLVVEIVLSVVKCVSMSQSKEGREYRRVLDLVEELTPWFRVLDANTYEKLHRVLVSHLYRCTLFLVEELACFDGDLVCTFCAATLTEYAKSSMKDQTLKCGRRICSSLFSQKENGSSFVVGVLMCVLDTIAAECKVEMGNTFIEFVELVSYCANKCRITSKDLCTAVALHLNKMAGDFRQVLEPLNLILRLYATGLNFTGCNIQSSGSDSITSKSADDESAFEILLDDGDELQHLATSIGLLDNYFHINSKENKVSFSAEHKIIAESEAISSSAKLCHIQNALHQFCDVFLFCHCCTSENKREEFDENNKAISSVAVAAFTLSFRTRINMQKSANFIRHVISNGWIQLQGLKFLFVNLHNIGVILYRKRQLKEASKAIKLCCRASWARVSFLCQMFLEKSKGLHDDLSEDAITDFVMEACKESSFLLDIVHQFDSGKVKSIVMSSLENWSAAANLFNMLPCPTALVKQWVKIECKLSKDDIEDEFSTFHCLLSSSANVSKRTLGIILEQELLAYEEMKALSPELCQKMQMKIFNILLQDVFITKDSCLQKSRILIRKGKALRACGTEGLKDCIHCFSEAISTINDMYGETCSRDIPVCHQLAVSYCLRALCIQEAEPTSKRVLQDIHAALNLWLSIHIPECSSTADQHDLLSKNTMLLLYNIVDLLSLKGYTKFHLDIYKLIIRLFKWKNVPLEKCLAILWEYRRINHALCTSPINEAFIMTFTEHCGENSKVIDFWISCIKGSQPLLVGFLQIFSFLFANLPQGSCHYKSSFRVDITIDEVKDTAEKLISRVPVSSHSVFLAGYLYYDLCERLTSNGRLIEALSFAKQAHQLRSKLFQEKFSQKYTSGLSDLQTFRLVATEVWSFSTISWELESCDLSPWNVLRCYLESTLQVGIIHEMIGNGTEAEALLCWGKMISSSQDLPLFIVSFSSMLGKLYCKKRIWDLAEKELQTAKQVMVDSSADISCLKCRLILEATIDQQLGDLYRSHLDCTTENLSIKRLSFAENLYKSALDKLNLSEWKNSVSSPEESCAASILSRNQLDAVTLFSTGEVTKVKMENKSRKAKKASQILPQEQCLISQNNSRLTRSKYRSCQDKSVSVQGEEQAGLTKYSNGKYVPAGTDPFSQKGSHVDVKSSMADVGSEITCICNKMKCWHCLPMEVMESGLVNNFIFMKWEFVRRRLSLRLLTGIGKCLGGRGEIHETHEIFLQSIFVLISRNPFSYGSSYVRPNFLLDLIGKEIPGDVFSVEHAAIIYNICWFSLKNYRSQDTRNICCDQSHIQITKIVSWLMLAFVLCREVPIIFQKVSRLLAAIYVLSASSEPFSLPPSSCKALSECHWASYFHHASLGTHLNHQFFSNMAGKLKAQNLLNVEGSHSTGPNCIRAETYNLLRLAPESLQGLEEFVMKFFEDLPCTTVICISLLGGALASLLRELLNYPSSVNAWVLLSRLNMKSQPVVILLPVDSVLEEVSDDDASSESGIHYEHKDLDKQWHCPWGSTVVDDVTPAFKTILEENYLSSSTFPLDDTKENRLQWWTQRKKLDHRLGKLLRDLEDLWLGPWRYLLLGECLDCERLDLIHKKLVHDLKSKCKMDVNESLLKIILGSARYSHGREQCFLQLYLNKGCYIGRVGFYDEKTRCKVFSNPCDRVEKKSALANQLISGAAEELEEEESVNREPIILVLDCEVQVCLFLSIPHCTFQDCQLMSSIHNLSLMWMKPVNMLPWENIPVLRTQEVYRMPSIGSISAILDRSHHHQEQAGMNAAAFPLIDPLDAFYLLNPSGDLSSSQAAFEKWFRDQNIEGKAGIAPTVEELAGALKSHDLFIYIGHGSGAQYIPRHEIQKLENCAATLLMGCSSGSLSLNGQYTPQGTHLSYLSAGSPVIVANLWEVTDKDIDRFGKAMLDAWLRERSSPSVACAQCRLVAELKSMSITGGKGDAKKKIPRKKLSKACSSVTHSIICLKILCILGPPIIINQAKKYIAEL
ncbi:unnamed protein product, partial [Vitis vinifera]